MPISGKEMLKLYMKSGWVVLRRKGSHTILSKAGFRQVIPVHNKDLGKGLERKLLKKLEEAK